VIGKDLRLRESPVYPGRKIKQEPPILVNSRITVTKKQNFTYKNRVLTFFFVEDRSGWVLDYSPGLGKKVLQEVVSRSSRHRELPRKILVKLYNVAIRAKTKTKDIQQELDSERKLRKREKIRYRKLERRFRQIEEENNNLTEVLKASKRLNKQLQSQVEKTKVTSNLKTKESVEVFFGGYEAQLHELQAKNETQKMYFDELLENLTRSRLEVIRLEGIIESYKSLVLEEESSSQLRDSANEAEGTSINDDSTQETVLIVSVERNRICSRSHDDVHNGHQKTITINGSTEEAFTKNAKHICVH